LIQLRAYVEKRVIPFAKLC